MSWIRKTPNGKYRACFRAPDGKTISQVFEKLGEAAKPGTAKGWLAEQGEAQANNDYIDPRKSKKRLGAFFHEDFLPGKVIEPSTRADYEENFSRYIGPLANRQLRSITASDISRWRAGLEVRGVGRSAIESVTKDVKAILNRAVALGFLAKSPARHIENPPIDPKEARVLDKAELGRLAGELSGQDRALVLLLAWGGLRIGEALGLRVENVDFLKRRVNINRAVKDVHGRIIIGKPKTKGSVRWVALPAFVMNELAPLCDSGDREALVFRNSDGTYLRANNWRRRVFYPACERAGIGVPKLDASGMRIGWEIAPPTIHDLRHSAASLMHQDGYSLLQAQAVLGHSNQYMTARYSHVFDDDLDKLAEQRDVAFRNASPNPAAFSRPFEGSEVVPLKGSSA